MLRYVSAIFRLIRVKQWVKNLFVFLPLIFAGHLLDPRALAGGCEAFITFCLMASAIYVINDIRDAEADRAHPVKRLRPVASGAVGVSTARILALLLAAASVALAVSVFAFTPAETLILVSYLVINILYTLWLKRIGIIDVIIIAVGFVLRVMLGGMTAEIWVSPWLIMMVFLVALLIAFGKRRDEVLRNEAGAEVRRSVTGYNRLFMDHVISLLAGTVIVAYICYTLSPAVEERFHSGYVFLTSVFAIAGILRYLQIVFVKADSGRPTDLMLRDRFIILCIVGWLLSFGIIIYL